MLPLVISLIVGLSMAAPGLVLGAGAAAREVRPGPDLPRGQAPVVLDVPYLPQTEALCGGAAVAMVFRYWGDVHADVHQFATLVDRPAGGIAVRVLVEAVEHRGWHGVPFQGSVDLLDDQIRRGRPVILLVEDRPGRHHFVVATGLSDAEVVLHDPAWGPSRHIPLKDLLRMWGATGFWSLLILPDEARKPVRTAVDRPALARTENDSPNACDRLLTTAVDEVTRRGIADADAILGEVHSRCPEAAGPLRELAGARFAERRWREAASLAEEALVRDKDDVYAWEVLASSRFMQDDLAGALRAWNRIGKPRVDSVQIEGLERMRYAFVAEALALQPNGLLTEERYHRAERRLQQLPGRSRGRIGYHPQPDGFAIVDIALVERQSRPRGPIAWVAAGAQTAINRELQIALPGSIGQGELWAASWRWWEGRPRAALSFATPHVGKLPGIWRVEGSWEVQTYEIGRMNENRSTTREEHLHGLAAVTDWLTGNLRYEVSAGLDAWNGARRAASIGGAIERRFLDDRVSLTANASVWMPLTADPGFRAAALRGTFRSLGTTVATGTSLSLTGGFEAVSAAAPLALWPGAGDGHARTPLLRAHPLLVDGVVTGSLLGRRLGHASVEVQRWIDKPWPARIGLAAFTDLVHVSRLLVSDFDSGSQIDVGVGLRVKMPGVDGTLRVDVGHGIRDGQHALTVGWQF